MLSGRRSSPTSSGQKPKSTAEIDFQSLLDDLEQTENLLRKTESLTITPPSIKSVTFVDETSSNTTQTPKNTTLSLKTPVLIRTVEYDERDPTCIISMAQNHVNQNQATPVEYHSNEFTSSNEPLEAIKDQNEMVLLAVHSSASPISFLAVSSTPSAVSKPSILKVKVSTVIPDFLPAEPLSEDETDYDYDDDDTDGDLSDTSELSPIDPQFSNGSYRRGPSTTSDSEHGNQDMPDPLEELLSSSSTSSGTETDSFSSDEDNGSIDFTRGDHIPPKVPSKNSGDSKSPISENPAKELTVGPRPNSAVSSISRIPSISRQVSSTSRSPLSPLSPNDGGLSLRDQLAGYMKQALPEDKDPIVDQEKKSLSRQNSISSSASKTPAMTPTVSAEDKIKSSTLSPEVPPKKSIETPTVDKSKVPTPSSTTIKTPVAAAAPEIKKITTRIYIEDARSFKTLILTSLMTAEQVVKDVIEGLHLEASPDWTLFELFNDLGIERPLRDWELVTDVLSSWNPTSSLNAIVMKKYVYRATVTPRSLNGRFPRAQGFLQLQTRPGKWQKKFCILKESNLYYYAESENPNSLTLICNLANFDVYTLSQAQKTPTEYCFAVKSTNSSTIFEKKEEYCRVLCVEKVERLYDWVFALRLAKSEKTLIDYPDKFKHYPDLSDKARSKLHEALEEKERKSKEISSNRTAATITEGSEPLLGRTLSQRRAEKPVPPEGYTNFGSRKPSIKISSKKTDPSSEKHRSPTSTEHEYEYAMKEKERRRAERARAANSGDSSHRPKESSGSSSSSSRRGLDGGHSSSSRSRRSGGEKSSSSSSSSKRSRKQKPLVDISDISNCRQCGCSEFKGTKGSSCSNCFHVHF